jgi:LmbE family N-acetylglucosaminyl deacetylase
MHEHIDHDIPMHGRPTASGAGTTIASLGTILGLWAHPDDETYLAGGLMAAARDGGQRVVCASASAGERGTDDPESWPPARLGAVRRWEAAAAMAVLGVHEHAVLGLPDGALAGHDEQGVAWAGGLIDDVRPDTIVTFGADGMTFHDDHIAVHRWVTAAWRARRCPARLLYATMTHEHLAEFGPRYDELGVYMADAQPTGHPIHELARHVVLDGAALDRKVTALRSMATQTGALIGALGPAAYAAAVAEEAFVAAPCGPKG